MSWRAWLSQHVGPSSVSCAMPLNATSRGWRALLVVLIFWPTFFWLVLDQGFSIAAPRSTPAGAARLRSCARRQVGGAPRKHAKGHCHESRLPSVRGSSSRCPRRRSRPASRSSASARGSASSTSLITRSSGSARTGAGGVSGGEGCFCVAAASFGQDLNRNGKSIRQGVSLPAPSSSSSVSPATPDRISPRATPGLWEPVERLSQILAHRRR